MTEFVFLDADDTILDFHQAERAALTKTLTDFGVEPTNAVLARYHIINRQHWEALERGELSRTQVQEGRFRVLFEELGRDIDLVAVARSFQHNLGIGHYFLPGAEAAVQTLHQKYRLFLATNGTASVQRSRLTSAGLYPYFEKVFISQEIGCNKPSKEFFQACFAQIPHFRRESAIMVGDSLTSDILGGIRAGMKTCWINPAHEPPRADIRPDYEIESLSQLPALLAGL